MRIFCVACKVFSWKVWFLQHTASKGEVSKSKRTTYTVSFIYSYNAFSFRRYNARLSLLLQQVFIVYLLLSKYTLTNTPSLQAPPPRAYYDKVGSFFVSLTRSVFHFIFSSVFNSFFQTFLALCVFISFLLTPSPSAPTPLAGRTPPLLARRVFNSAWSDRRERKAS